MPEYKNKVVKELLRRSDINSNIQVVANTYMNISYDQLTKKLSLLNAHVNRQLFRWYQKYPETRIVFYYNHERVENNVHSHIILKIPPKYGTNKVIFLLHKFWRKFDDRILTKFQMHIDRKVKNEVANVTYAFKKFHIEKPETFWVI